MKKNKYFNWIIVGSGDVVRRLLNDSFNIKNKSSVKAILSKDYQQAKKLSKKLNVDKVYKNIKDIKDFSKFNWVYIATPPKSHFYYIKKFSEKKINILCEKPLTTNLSNLKKIIHICKKNKIVLETTYYRRFQKRFKFIENILKKKYLGKIIYFRHSFLHDLHNHPTAKIYNKKKIPWRFKKEISGGGNFLDMGPHVIDLISLLFGEIQKIQFMQNNKLKIYNVEENTIINIFLKNKIIGQSIWSSVSKLYEDKFEIFGAKGYISFSMNLNPNIHMNIGKKIYKKKLNFEKPFYKNMVNNLVNRYYHSKNIDREANCTKVFSVSKFQLEPYK